NVLINEHVGFSTRQSCHKRGTCTLKLQFLRIFVEEGRCRASLASASVLSFQILPLWPLIFSSVSLIFLKWITSIISDII
ncbi:7183_t:CDS:1, partial [Gigaspora rosea]